MSAIMEAKPATTKDGKCNMNDGALVRNLRKSGFSLEAVPGFMYKVFQVFNISGKIRHVFLIEFGHRPALFNSTNHIENSLSLMFGIADRLKPCF